MQLNFDNLFESLMLMGVGLVTVFVVLLLVINLGNLLIAFINKFIPEEAPKPAAGASSASAVDPDVAMAIGLAVGKLTGGKSKVQRIERI